MSFVAAGWLIGVNAESFPEMPDSISRAVSPVEVAAQLPQRGFGPLDPPPGRSVQSAIDPVHSRVEFTTRFLGVFTVRGTITGLTGEIRYHTADPRRWSVNAEVPMRTVDTRLRLRDAHLRSRDYLDVLRYPLAVFRSTAIERQNDALLVHGMLTLRDQTKPVVVRFAYPERPRRDGDEREIVEATGRIVIDRRHFGIVGHQPGGFRLDPRDATIGSHIALTITVRGVRIR